MHLWLPKSSAADADAGTGGGGDFMKSYGALRSIQKLMTRKVDAICDKSPDELIKRVRKYLNNINERIQNGSLKGDNLAKRKEFAQTWHTNWYGDYESGAQPESWPSTLPEAIANGNKERITVGRKEVAAGSKDDGNGGAEVTGGSGGVKGSNNTGAGGEGSGKKSKLRVSCIPPAFCVVLGMLALQIFGASGAFFFIFF